MGIESLRLVSETEILIPTEKLKAGTKIYMAGPYGFAEATRPTHTNLKEIVTLMGGETLDPWELTPQAQITAIMALPYGEQRRDAWTQINNEIGRRNIQAIDEASGVIAVLDGVDVDSGTAAEIGYAFARKLPILGYRGDFRLSADNEGGIVNLQVETFIRDSANGKGTIVRSVSELPAEIMRIWG